MLTNKTTFGHVRKISDNVEETRTIDFVLSNYTRDRHCTVLNQDNWHLDSYCKNPVVGYMHDVYGDGLFASDPDMVIGMGINPRTEGTGKNKILVCSAQFEPASLNLIAEKVFRKLIFGSLSRTSVGFGEIGTGSWGTGNEAQGRENETYYFKGQELLEWSIVNISSNPDSGKRHTISMRSQTKGALVYALSEMGKSYALSQIENMRVSDVLALLDGRDLEIREKNPEKVHKMLSSKGTRADVNEIIEKQQIEFRRSLLGLNSSDRVLSDSIELVRRDIKINKILNKFSD